MAQIGQPSAPTVLVTEPFLKSLSLPYTLVNTIAISDSIVYVGGWFEDVNNNGSILGQQVTLPSGMEPIGLPSVRMVLGNGSLNDEVKTIAVNGSDVYAGGYFSNVNNNGSVLTAADTNCSMGWHELVCPRINSRKWLNKYWKC